MRCLLTLLLTLALTASAVAQSGVLRAGGGEFSAFKTYWSEKREGCQPMISLRIKNISTGDIGPIALRLEVVDRDTTSVFATGTASVSSTDLPPGHTKDIALGGNHDITPHECLGDMHEMAFSSIHFVIRLNAAVGQDAAAIVELVRDQPMSEERVPSQN